METILNITFLFAALLGFVFLYKHSKSNKLDTRTWLFSIAALILIPLGLTWGVTSFYENEPQAGWVGIFAFTGLGLVSFQLARKGIFPQEQKKMISEPIQKLGYKIAVICLLAIGFLTLPFGISIKQSVNTVSDKQQLMELMSENIMSDDAMPKLVKKSIAYMTLYGEYPDNLETRLMSYMFSGVEDEEMIEIFAYILSEEERLTLLNNGADAVSNWLEGDASYPELELYPSEYLVKVDAHAEDIARWIFKNFALPDMTEETVAKFENGEFSNDIQDYLGTPPEHLKESLIEPLAAIIRTQLDSVDIPKKVSLAEEIAKTIPEEEMLANKEQIKTMFPLLSKLWLIPLLIIIIAFALVFIGKLNWLKFVAWSIFALGLRLIPCVLIFGNPQDFVDGVIPRLAEQVPAPALGVISKILPSLIQPSSEIFNTAMYIFVLLGIALLMLTYFINYKKSRIMKEHNCENCKMRANYNKKPKSFMGKFWRWHINWCPGWKSYMKSLDEEKKAKVISKYKLDTKL